VFYEEVFRKLSDREVKYVVAGGVALVLHGVVRRTDRRIMGRIHKTETNDCCNY
jgi:hypothetical protein